MKKALYITDRFDEIYSPELQRLVEGMVDLIAEPQRSDIVRRNPGLLRGVEIVMSGWGGARLDQALLDSAPRLEAFFYAGGCVKSIITPAVWERGIVVCSSINANSIPVAEHSLAQIILCLKHTYQAAAAYRRDCAMTYSLRNVTGAYGGMVGLVGLGRISRILLRLLKPFDVRVLAYDPGVSEEEMREAGVKKTSLETVFSESDVVSLHAPVLPSTTGMITGKLICSMKTGASLINTARGVLIREDELISALRSRTDLCAVLDVTDPEPPVPDSDLWTLPNVLLTPHIAGSQGMERFRVGRMMVEDLERYLRNQPLCWREQAPGVLKGEVRRSTASISTEKKRFEGQAESLQLT